MMRSLLIIQLSCGLLAGAGTDATAQSLGSGTRVNFIRQGDGRPDLARQAELRAAPAWQDFVNAHPGWAVEFNEASGKPHRAFGPPIPTAGDSPEERAMQFITGSLSPFGIPFGDLVHRVTVATSKFQFVHFGQVHEDVPVIKGHLLVKLDLQGRVVLFGLEVHDDIDVLLIPGIPEAAASVIASEGLGNVQGAEYNGLHILPVPEGRRTDHRLVHELLLITMDHEMPGRHLCWVDAHTGELLYRWDLVTSGCANDHDRASGADVTVQATALVNGPLEPAQVVGLADLRLSINGDLLYTDADGFLQSGVPGPVDASLQLRGRWANVNTGGATPSFTQSLMEGPNQASFDAAANIRQRTAYHAVNAIHAHMKNTLPAFTGMDIVLPTNVDLTSGNCNAFYDGSSINFYAEGNNCRSFATMPDVVYHEYGHGINDKYYQSLASSFTNGAMNEGYADVWALTLTQQPVLAQGNQLNNANSYIRRYDVDPKVYPVDLVGQVHADGEIIAGAWWDTHQLLDDPSLTMQLFAEAYPGLQATAFNGQEGQAFRDVLIDVLQADDDDQDITNGTPNGPAIVEGFAIHGITLLSNVDLQHAPLVSALAAQDIALSAEVGITFPFNAYLAGVRAFYRVNDDADWSSVLMTNSTGNTYEAVIPQQEQGSVVAYFVAVEDIFGQLSSVLPVGASQEDPNIPYFILVGYGLQASEDADLVHELGDWTIGVAGDNATTGVWEENVPVPSYSGSNGSGVVVQPGTQHTPGGEFCWITQNASGPFAGMGEADVDGGSTTLISDNIDLTGYVKPAFTYWRWYINNPPGGANPNADWWQTYISNDGGVSWVPVEDTRTSDRSWRRMAFRVEDHVEVTATIRLKFVVSDSLRPGQNLDGGSLVEGALDDIQLWDAAGSTIGVQEHMAHTIVALYPDPASDEVQLTLGNAGDGLRRIEVMDLAGHIVLVPPIAPGAGADRHRVDIGRLAAGQYVLRCIWDEGSAERRFTVVR